jgi:ribosomal protein S14
MFDEFGDINEFLYNDWLAREWDDFRPGDGVKSCKRCGKYNTLESQPDGSKQCLSCGKNQNVVKKDKRQGK